MSFRHIFLVFITGGISPFGSMSPVMNLDALAGISRRSRQVANPTFCGVTASGADLRVCVGLSLPSGDGHIFRELCRGAAALRVVVGEVAEEVGETGAADGTVAEDGAVGVGGH